MNEKVVNDNQSQLPMMSASKLSFHYQKIIWGIIFLAPLILGFLLFFFYPFVMSVYYSFCEVKITGNGIEAVFLKFENYSYAWSSHATFTQVLWESTYGIFIDIFVLLFFSLLMAVILNGDFKGKTVVRAIFFIPVVLNSEAINQVIGSNDALGIADALGQSGAGALNNVFNLQTFLSSANFPTFMTDLLTAVVAKLYSIVTYSGIQIIIFLATIQSIPRHLYEAAKIEGATKYEIFWKITFPMVTPMFMPILVYTVMDSFSKSKLNSILDVQSRAANLGRHAAMSWLYLFASLLIIVIYYILMKGMIFTYEEERKRKPKVL